MLTLFGAKAFRLHTALATMFDVPLYKRCSFTSSPLRYVDQGGERCQQVSIPSLLASTEIVEEAHSKQEDLIRITWYSMKGGVQGLIITSVTCKNGGVQ